ncbi:MAG: hypothetical protein Ct9H300mP3_09890 [Gammaproteobacteria bacterium]|nr:MAG: hypothetical protein Ct9H300mP3_09890 [Gammaproteobacteria bacterium]
MADEVEKIVSWELSEQMRLQSLRIFKGKGIKASLNEENLILKVRNLKFPSFDLERIQSIYENSVEINLTESGIEPLSLKELMNPKKIRRTIKFTFRLWVYARTPLLRQRISNLYEGADENNVLVTSGSSEAIFLSAVLTVSKGDRVVMMTPIIFLSMELPKP